MTNLKERLKKFNFLRNLVVTFKEWREKVWFNKIFSKMGIKKYPRRKALLYPDNPRSYHTIRKVLKLLNYDITNQIAGEYHFAAKWHHPTFKDDLPELLEIAQKRFVLNFNSRDVSKRKVDEIFKEVFGYSTFIDPTSFVGKCVKKSNLNALHDGQIINCPIDKVEDDFIYQIVINNTVNDNLVQDIRVPILRDVIPFVYLKYRPIDTRFKSQNLKTTFAHTNEVLSEDEKQKIIQVCKKIGLDHCEMDVLRNKDDHKIYVVDINDTPGGFPKKLARKDKEQALFYYAKGFYEIFLKS